MQDTFKPKLRGFTKLILGLLAQVGNLFANNIKDLEVKQMVQGALQAVSQTIDSLSDSNPNDKEQIRQIFNDLLKAGPFKDGSMAELMAKINTIEDDDTRVFLSTLLTQAYEIADILTDSDIENTEQMRQYVRDLLRSENGMLMLRSLLGILLSDTYADTATLLIIQLLQSVLEEEGDNTPFAAVLVELKDRYQKKVLAA